MSAFILGLDISSTCVGYVAHAGAVRDHGVIRLDKTAWIGQRCVAARDAVAAILDQYAVDCVVVESPVCRYAKAVIPQARVSGALLELAERRGIMAVEVTPSAAKLALAGDGAATKREMLQAAAAHFGYEADALAYIERRGDWMALTSGAGVYSEHEADALGLCLAMVGKVEIHEAVL